MCSEACTTGKSVFIFQPEHQFAPYKELHKYLIEAGHAKLLNKGHIDLNWSPDIVLNEAERVAKLLKATFTKKDTGR
jgi:mitochondrial fission protein ELM1